MNGELAEIVCATCGCREDEARMMAQIVKLTAALAEMEQRLLRQATKHAAATKLVGGLKQEKQAFGGALEKIIDAFLPISEQREALGRLWSQLFDRICDGLWTMDSGDLEEIAESVGLLQRVPYDVDQHASLDGEPGDMVFVLTDLGRAAHRTSIKPVVVQADETVVCSS